MSTPLCYDTHNVTIKIGVLNNPFQYTYEWTGPFSGIQTSQEISDLSPGKYKVTVTEKFGNRCSESDSIIIPEPPSDVLTDVLTFPINCKGQADGIAEAKVTGFTSDYKYQWFSERDNRYLEQSYYRVTGLLAGSYILTLTTLNADSCKSTKHFVITEALNDPSEKTLYPNPTDGKFTLIICDLREIAVNYQVISVSGEIMAKGSEIVYRGMIPFDLTGYLPGIYIISVDIDGKKANYKVIKR